MSLPKDPIKINEYLEKQRKVRSGKTWEEIFGKEKAKEWKEHLSKARKGIPLKEATKIKMSLSQMGSKNHRYGKHHTSETIKKLSEANKGQIPWNTGKHLSEEHKEKIRNNAKINPNYGNSGKHQSKESILKMVKTRLEKNNFKHKEETKLQMSISHKGRKPNNFRKDITKENILKAFEMVINKHGKSIGRMAIRKEAQKILNCSFKPIDRLYGNLESILQELNVNMPFKRIRKDISKKTILDTFQEIINEHGVGIGKEKIKELVTQRLKCSWTPISKKCKSMYYILHDLNIDIPRSMAWKSKQDIIEEVVREYEGTVQTRKYHKGIGIPDIETPTKVYDAKSYLYMGWQDQLDRYTQLNKDVRFIVFENKGKTDVPSERIIFLRELVQKLPDNKRLLIQEKIERIKMDIPLEQKSLNEVVN